MRARAWRRGGATAAAQRCNRHRAFQRRSGTTPSPRSHAAHGRTLPGTGFAGSPSATGRPWRADSTRSQGGRYDRDSAVAAGRADHGDHSALPLRRALNRPAGCASRMARDRGPDRDPVRKPHAHFDASGPDAPGPAASASSAATASSSPRRTWSTAAPGGPGLAARFSVARRRRDAPSELKNVVHGVFQQMLVARLRRRGPVFARQKKPPGFRRAHHH